MFAVINRASNDTTTKFPVAENPVYQMGLAASQFLLLLVQSALDWFQANVHAVFFSTREIKNGLAIDKGLL